MIRRPWGPRACLSSALTVRGDERIIRIVCRRLTLAFLALAVPVAAAAQHHELGTVTFPTSCDPTVQAEFERGVAMLHSYWFSYAGKTFQSVLQQDPKCAMAYWGIALDLLGNTLSSPPPPAMARAAWDALEKARTVEPKSD